MKEISKCEDCFYWEFVFKRGYNKYGFCDHPLVPDKILMDKNDESDADEKAIHTHSNFGCIEFTRKDGNVLTKIDPDETE